MLQSELLAFLYFGYLVNAISIVLNSMTQEISTV